MESPADVAAAIDRQVIGNYRLRPPNLWACRELDGDAAVEGVAIHEGSCSEAAFWGRIDAMPESDRPYALAAYANALRSVREYSATP